MERGQVNRIDYKRKPRRRSGVHGGVKVLVYLFVSALMFAVGMVIGGMLSQDSFAEGEGAGGGKNRPVTDPAVSKIEVVCIDQREDYPTGCESVTAVMALGHAGVDLSVDDFIDRYLPMSRTPQSDDNGVYHVEANPREAYLGDPRTQEGWGCYAPVIRKAVEAVLAAEDSAVKVEDLTGQPISALCQDYVFQGVPVMVWATQGMASPSYGPTMVVEETGERFDWISPEHCLLLIGEDEGNYWFNDPLEGGEVAYEKKAAETAYQALGSQALALR